MSAQEAIAQADQSGWIEIRSGVYLDTAKYMRSTQQEFLDDDPARSMDFSGPGYWITTKCGAMPKWISGADDESLLEIFSEEGDGECDL